MNARAAGPRLGKDVQVAIKAVKAGEGVLNRTALTAGPATLVPGSTRPSWWPRTPSSRRSCLVVRDWWFSTATSQRSWRPRVGPRTVSVNCRTCGKSSGLDVSDRIQVLMSVPAEQAELARTHRDLIAGEILATSFRVRRSGWGSEIGDGVRVRITRA